MPQKLPEIPSNNISIQSGVELYKEIRASFLEAKRFLLLFCSRYNAFTVFPPPFEGQQIKTRPDSYIATFFILRA